MASARLRLHYCKVILATSLVWVMIDVFVIMYFTDCNGTDGGKCGGQWCSVLHAIARISDVRFALSF